MGTLTITYGTTTHTLTCTGAPSVSYNYNRTTPLLSAGTWSGTKTFNCAKKYLVKDITIGRNVNGSAITTTLKTAGKLANNNIVFKYTADSSAIGYQTVTVTGTSTLTVPSPYNRVQFFCVGGGGGGGSLDYNSSYKQCAWGGGGGGYVATSSVITTTPGSKFTTFVGTGGAVNCNGNTTYVKSGSTTLVSAAGGKAGGSPSSTTTTYTSANSRSYIKAYIGGAGGSGGNGGRAMGGTTGDHYWSTFSNSNLKYGTNGSNGRYGYATPYGDYSGSYTYTADSAGSGASTTDPWNTTIIYSGGGGGGSTSPTQSGLDYCGKTSGGGRGGTSYKSEGMSNATAGTAGTGGGGGGGSLYTSATYFGKGAAGGSGVIRIKFWEA